MPPSAAATEALTIRESIELREGALDSDGTVLLHILRPCLGKGRGSHLYEADMLEREAPKFGGWKMYTNHLSDTARKALEGLPRPVEHIGGKVVESWWDPDVPADPDAGLGKGAVIGRVRPIGVAKDIIEQDPSVIEASINARATRVRPVRREGRQVYLVEGIRDGGSIDWVTEAGAGGRVAQLIEASYHRQRDEEMTLLETLTDDELREHLEAERPELAKSLTEAKNGDQPTPAEAPPQPKPAEFLREALQDESVREAVNSIVDERVEAETADLRAELDVREADARAASERQRHLSRLCEAAHTRIDGAKLKPKATDELKRRFGLSESGRPTPALDIVDELDESGAVVKSADERLAEAVDAEIASVREMLAEAAPTRVRGQGAGGGKPAPAGAKRREAKPEHVTLLAEAGVDDPESAWDDPGIEEPPERKPEKSEGEE